MIVPKILFFEFKSSITILGRLLWEVLKDFAFLKMCLQDLGKRVTLNFPRIVTTKNKKGSRKVCENVALYPSVMVDRKGEVTISNSLK